MVWFHTKWLICESLGRCWFWRCFLCHDAKFPLQSSKYWLLREGQNRSSTAIHPGFQLLKHEGTAPKKVGCPTNHWMQPVESSAHWRPFGMLLHCLYCACTNFKSLMAKLHTLNLRRHRSKILEFCSWLSITIKATHNQSIFGHLFSSRIFTERDKEVLANALLTSVTPQIPERSLSKKPHVLNEKKAIRTFTCLGNSYPIFL